MKKISESFICDFCGETEGFKDSGARTCMILAEGSDTTICEGCVDICNELIADQHQNWDANNK